MRCRFSGPVSPSSMNAPAKSFEEELVTPVCIVSLILGLSVAEAPLTDEKHPLQQGKPVLTVLVRDLVDLDSRRDGLRAGAYGILSVVRLLRFDHCFPSK